MEERISLSEEKFFGVLGEKSKIIGVFSEYFLFRATTEIGFHSSKIIFHISENSPIQGIISNSARVTVMLQSNGKNVFYANASNVSLCKAANGGYWLQQAGLTAKSQSRAALQSTDIVKMQPRHCEARFRTLGAPSQKHAGFDLQIRSLSIDFNRVAS